jgi:fumarate hydratase class II
LDELLAVLDSLAGTLRAKAAEFDGVVKSGRTHLQDAVPVRLGQEFGGYARAVERDRVRVERAADGLRRLGIGGTATGTGLNAHPEYHARTGPTTGLDEIRLPAVQPGSSIMPGKVNPVLAEMLNQAMFHVMGNDHTVALAAQAGQLELNVMMPIIAHNLFEAMQVMIGAVRAFTERAVRGVTAQGAKAEGWLARNPIIATALNPLIGYLQAAELVKDAMQRNLTLREVAAERIAAGQLLHKDTGQPVALADVDIILGDLRQMTEGGLGGPAGGG